MASRLHQRARRCRFLSLSSFSFVRWIQAVCLFLPDFSRQKMSFSSPLLCLSLLAPLFLSLSFPFFSRPSPLSRLPSMEHIIGLYTRAVESLPSDAAAAAGAASYLLIAAATVLGSLILILASWCRTLAHSAPQVTHFPPLCLTFLSFPTSFSFLSVLCASTLTLSSLPLSPSADCKVSSLSFLYFSLSLPFLLHLCAPLFPSFPSFPTLS